MRVLVAYETAHGSTAETAERIAQVLRDRGAEVDVMRCRKVGSLEGYDAFVVGSPIWAGKWLKPARRFVVRHEGTLSSRPTAYFCASGAASREEGRADVERQIFPKLRNYAEGVEPVAIGNFAGVINFPAYGLLLRLVMRAISKSQGAATSGYHDMRDWEQIEAWASEVYDLLAERLGGAGGENQ
jgi:menaquinone-dependent protoporphyrinogen oxidase